MYHLPSRSILRLDDDVPERGPLPSARWFRDPEWSEVSAVFRFRLYRADRIPFCNLPVRGVWPFLPVWCFLCSPHGDGWGAKYVAVHSTVPADYGKEKNRSLLAVVFPPRQRLTMFERCRGFMKTFRICGVKPQD